MSVDETLTVSPADGPPPPALTTGDRYVLGDEIARGGMGIVHRAVDRVLGREVAVKVLHGRFDTKSAVAGRFADEARIAAQLQHPGIPPIHDLGTLPDGRPFLAMKLIQGNTLEELLRDRADLADGRGRFVAVFEQVCQAVGYAHDRRVIHRDLKPANIMVGSFAEVQVMDWGLAKVLGGREAGGDAQATAGSTSIKSARESDGSYTQAGSVLGTPAYMAPEQALGTIGRVDERADVFGLGGVLAAILTGKPPFAAGSAEKVRLQSAQAKLDDCFARLDASGADPDLIDLCKRCLAGDLTGRPANAGEVAQAVAGLRQAADDRARRAEADRVAAEAKLVEQRKRRRVQVALTAAVGAMLVAAGLFVWWRYDQERLTVARYERSSLRLANLLTQCEEALAAEDADRASLAYEAARGQFDDGTSPVLIERMVRCGDDVALLRDLDALDVILWTRVDGRYDQARLARERKSMFRRYGIVPGETPVADAAQRIRTSPFRDRLVNQLDWWVSTHVDDLAAAELLRQADGDPFRTEVRETLAKEDPVRRQALLARPELRSQPPRFTAMVLRELDASGPMAKVILRDIYLRQPNDLSVLMAIGYTDDDPVVQAGYFRAAVALRPGNAAAWSGLGYAHYAAGDHLAALACYEEWRRLEPKEGRPRQYIGSVLDRLGRYAEAAAAYREAIRLTPDLPYARLNLARALIESGELAEAEETLREGLKQQHGDPRMMAVLAGLLRIRGDDAEAGTLIERALALDPEDDFLWVAAGDVWRTPTTVRASVGAYLYAHFLDPSDPVALRSLGTALQEHGDYTGAIAAFRIGLSLAPRHVESWLELGNVHHARREYAAAEVAYREVIRIAPDHAFGHGNLSDVLFQRGDLAGAEREARRAMELRAGSPVGSENLKTALRIARRRPKVDDVLAGRVTPENPAATAEYAECLSYPVPGRYAEAARLYEVAFTADPTLVREARHHLGQAIAAAALASTGQGAGAPVDTAGRATMRSLALKWLRSAFEQELESVRRGGWERTRAHSNIIILMNEPATSQMRPGLGWVALSPVERAEWGRLWKEMDDAIRR